MTAVSLTTLTTVFATLTFKTSFASAVADFILFIVKCCSKWRGELHAKSAKSARVGPAQKSE